jgi:ectoine hydroxylase-related dioxygenase (phytanoyl-CoA dioxygenase family)
MQIVNIWHSDSLFQRLATSTTLGKIVADVTGWWKRGVRLAQDQIWVKPPHSGPLSFHRDTTYFDIEPREVATVWISFDTLSDRSLGPLEYCRGSHLWSLARRGSANQFFDNDYRCMLRDAARREIAAIEAKLSIDSASDVSCNESLEAKLTPQERMIWHSARELDVIPVIVSAGGCSIHNGNTWHGSGPNLSSAIYRRGMGIHFIPGDATFADEVGRMWAPYKAAGSNELPIESFPYVFAPLSG